MKIDKAIIKDAVKNIDIAKITTEPTVLTHYSRLTRIKHFLQHIYKVTKFWLFRPKPTQTENIITDTEKPVQKVIPPSELAEIGRDKTKALRQSKNSYISPGILNPRLTRSFGGNLHAGKRLANGEKNPDRNIEKKHLKAYLRGETHFDYGRVINPSNNMPEACTFKVKENWK